MNSRIKNHSKLVLFLLALDVLIQIAQLWLNTKLNDGIDLFLEGKRSQALKLQLDQLVQFNNLLYYSKIISFIILGIVILSWIYRAHRFVHTRVDAVNLKFTDAACVVYFFIPIANLFMPYKAMKETWLASQYPDSWRNKPTPITLVIWWTLWLLYLNLAILIPPVWFEFQTLALVQEMTLMTNTISVLSILLSGVFALIVLQIEHIQSKYAAEPTQNSPTQPPNNVLVS
ncbi:MAG: DUF4328 domain-containing protein [Pasteurella oralis]|uniref:DUF4328 domain-containing protein n=1 Tax=Pasteurella oralis TaxID=1071947 RepID=UPI00270CF75C|nr:DUF4328 domain-containing protein [Pasteurella oralis]